MADIEHTVWVEMCVFDTKYLVWALHRDLALTKRPMDGLDARLARGWGVWWRGCSANQSRLSCQPLR
eukprot:SAG11_NODE_2811_length_2947_cov_3.850720_4_plen_67_part_00